MDVLACRPARPAGPRSRSKTRLEQVRLLAGGVELGLAVVRARSPRARSCRARTRQDTPVTIWRWLRSRPSAMRRIAASFSTTACRYGFSRRQFSCAAFGPAALVVPGERGEHLDLVGREARQVAVRDQVVGVPLVLGVADVAADVVQQRPVLEPLPLGRGQLVEGVRLVEELERQPGDVRRVEHLGVAAPQQPVHAARPHVAVRRRCGSRRGGRRSRAGAPRAGPAPRRRSRRRPCASGSTRAAGRPAPRCRAAAGRAPEPAASPSRSCGGAAC